MQTVVDYSIVKTVVADWLYVNKTEMKFRNLSTNTDLVADCNAK